jgi:RNA polymerase sigma-70 factor (ECF subfamily)
MDDDEALLNRLASGDEAAFRVLVERHIDRAFGIALRIVGSRADAEDVVHDVMLEVWTDRAKWRCRRANFPRWLCRVIISRCAGPHRLPATGTADPVAEPMDVRPDAAIAMPRDEVAQMLEHAIRLLPQEERVAVVLSYQERMGNGEIEEVMGTTPAAVGSLLKQARRKLKNLLPRQARDRRFAADRIGEQIVSAAAPNSAGDSNNH